MAPFRRFVPLALAALLVTSVVACGTDTEEADVTDTAGEGLTPTTHPTPTPTTSTTAPLSNTELPTISGRPQQPPKGPTDAFDPVTLRGRIAAGLSQGCVELVTSGGRYALLGDLVTSVAPGDEVEVVGLPAPQIRLACDGTPLEVSAVRRL